MAALQAVAVVAVFVGVDNAVPAFARRLGADVGLRAWNEVETTAVCRPWRGAAGARARSWRGPTSARPRLWRYATVPAPDGNEWEASLQPPVVTVKTSAINDTLANPRRRHVMFDLAWGGQTWSGQDAAFLLRK